MSRKLLQGVALFALLAAACGESSTVEPDNDATRIAAIQGDGHSSPLADQQVEVDAIVTGDFQDTDADSMNNLGGFFITDRQQDDDAATSDGLFVFDGDRNLADVKVGDIVTVTGRVQEHFGETQLVATAIEVRGRVDNIPVATVTLPVATTVDSDGNPVADLERYEGMLVNLPQTLAVTDLFELGRYGSLSLSANGRLYQFTNSEQTGNYAAHREDAASRTIILDDGQRSRNTRPVRYLGGDLPLRTGDSIRNLRGNLRYSRGSGGSGIEGWRVVPAPEFSVDAFDQDNPRPEPPPPHDGLRVASFNVLNYFSTIDNGDNICGPRQDDGCRGADSVAERARQLAKIVAALQAIDADIVGLVELENNDSQSLADIVEALNETSNRSYDYAATGSFGTDPIKTGFIYDTTSVTTRGDAAILDTRIDTRFNDDRNRPALAQTFDFGDERLTIAVNHFKSKGSPCDAEDDPNRGDGQGNCNGIRAAAAESLADWLANDPTSSGDPDVLIIGDLNAYREEDPLTALREAGYTNLLDNIDNAYTFVFDGMAGALDHALVNESLLGQVAALRTWPINADESRLLDYNIENDVAAFAADSPFRSSDHDPLIIDFTLGR